MAGELSPAAMQEAADAATEAKHQADLTRDFVLSFYQTLRGKHMPVEITSIQNLPRHSCLIVNDHFLWSYREAEQFIRSIHVSDTDD